MTPATALIRCGYAASLAAAAYSHAYLYVHGYQHVPHVGPGFLVQASLSFALALSILLGGPAWLGWAGAAVAGASLAAFVASRTVGLLGFSEHGWEPAPHAALSVAAEAGTVALWAAVLVARRRRSAA